MQHKCIKQKQNQTSNINQIDVNNVFVWNRILEFIKSRTSSIYRYAYI